MRRGAAPQAVTIGSVYELEYAAALVLDLLLLNFHEVLITRNFLRPTGNPTVVLLRI